jgi:hypothetical protein
MSRTGRRLWFVYSALGLAVLALVGIASARPALTSPEPAPTETPVRLSQSPLSTTPTLTPTPAVDDPLSIEVSRSYPFIWPAIGPLTSYFAPDHPMGIDIGLDPSVNSPIVASAAGVVTVAGGDPCCEYGYHVILDHGQGLTTVYAHLSRIGVRLGQKVEQGQQIGLGGDTGYSEGKHLHFEVRLNDSYLEPLRFLPVTQPPEMRVVLRPEVTSCASAELRLDRGSAATLKVGAPGVDYLVTGATLAPVKAGNDPVSVSPTLGGTTVTLEAARASRVDGRVDEHRLEISLSRDGAESVLECRVLVVAPYVSPAALAATRTMATRHRGTATPSPAPAGSATTASEAAPVPSTETPLPTATPPFGTTYTPSPTNTSTPVPTETFVVASTWTPSPVPTNTPIPSPTATPTPRP